MTATRKLKTYDSYFKKYYIPFGANSKDVDEKNIPVCTFLRLFT